VFISGYSHIISSMLALFDVAYQYKHLRALGYTTLFANSFGKSLCQLCQQVYNILRQMKYCNNIADSLALLR